MLVATDNDVGPFYNEVQLTLSDKACKLQLIALRVEQTLHFQPADNLLQLQTSFNTTKPDYYLYLRQEVLRFVVFVGVCVCLFIRSFVCSFVNNIVLGPNISKTAKDKDSVTKKHR